MNRIKLKNCGLWLAAVTALSIFGSNELEAVMRHCDGTIQAAFRSGFDGEGKLINPAFRSTDRSLLHNTRPMVTFRGRGEDSNANDARRRARQAIIVCAKTLWDTRKDRRIPTNVCSPVGLTETDRRAAILNWEGKFKGDIKRSIEWYACCSNGWIQTSDRAEHPWKKTINSAVMAIDIVGYGKKRCSHFENLSITYEVNCSKLRNDLCS